MQEDLSEGRRTIKRIMGQKLEKKTELQRLLSKLGYASRKTGSVLIRDGLVKVNGRIVKNPSAYISVNSKIEVHDKLVESSTNRSPILIAFNKPRGVVTTSSDEKARKTVYEALPKKYQHLKAVGRLDMATTGLLLFTNDNKLADRLLDPKNKITRTYVVTIRHAISEEKIDRLRNSLTINGVVYYIADLKVKKISGKESTLLLTLQEGKNREIRNIFKYLGHEVIKLKRISFGKIELGDLQPGETKEIDPKFFGQR